LEGGGKGRKVGPGGECIAAAWSPDGKWMYFNSAAAPEHVGSRVNGAAQGVNGVTHLWRQRYPDGVPEQITFGPAEEQGLAIAPDGKSIITSVGVRKSSVWLHDGAGERPISPEGAASDPKMTADGKRVFYLLRKNGSNVNELWSTDAATGKANPALAGVSMSDFDISLDGQQVAYTSQQGNEDVIFVAPLDASGPPRLVVRGSDSVSFGAPGELIFRQVGAQANYLARIKLDGGTPERLLDHSILEKESVSPGGDWVVVGGISGSVKGVFAMSLKDRTLKTICIGLCLLKWSPDGQFLYLTTRLEAASTGRTLVLPIARGQGLPAIPEGGFSSNVGDDLPGVRVVREGQLDPGPGADTYAFTKSDFVGNLFRIPLH
jgi:dipeptidyl aminopeptidase/acylaminoacyl peptidase